MGNESKGMGEGTIGGMVSVGLRMGVPNHK